MAPSIDTFHIKVIIKALKSHVKDSDLHLMSSLNYGVTSHSGGWWWEGLFVTIKYVIRFVQTEFIVVKSHHVCV